MDRGDLVILDVDYSVSWERESGWLVIKSGALGIVLDVQKSYSFGSEHRVLIQGSTVWLNSRHIRLVQCAADAVG